MWRPEVASSCLLQFLLYLIFWDRVCWSVIEPYHFSQIGRSLNVGDLHNCFSLSYHRWKPQYMVFTWVPRSKFRSSSSHCRCFTSWAVFLAYALTQVLLYLSGWTGTRCVALVNLALMPVSSSWVLGLHVSTTLWWSRLLMCIGFLYEPVGLIFFFLINLFFYEL